jgi:hypothetical protein
VGEIQAQPQHKPIPLFTITTDTSSLCSTRINLFLTQKREVSEKLNNLEGTDFKTNLSKKSRSGDDELAPSDLTV